MTWVLLLEGLETEYTEEDDATPQHRKPFFYGSEEKDQNNLGCSALCMTTGRNWVDEKAQQCLRGHLRRALEQQWRFSTYSVGTEPYAQVLPPVFKKKYTTLQKTSGPKEKSNSPCCGLEGKYEMQLFLDTLKNQLSHQKRLGYFFGIVFDLCNPWNVSKHRLWSAS